MNEVSLMPANLGPAMSALNDKQRAFVIAMFALGCRDPVEAARAAGYPDNGGTGIRVQAHRLAHNENVQAAILEESKRRVRSLLPFAVNKLEEMADTPGKNQFPAVMAVLNRGGLHEIAERNVNVTVSLTREEQDERITLLAQKLGLDPIQLLGSVDAEFDDVTTVAPDGEPW